MRQAPMRDADVINDIELATLPMNYHLLNPGEFKTNRCNNSLKKIFAYCQAYATELGNFPANYFIGMKILEILEALALFLMGQSQDEDLHPVASAACYLMAFHFAFQSLWFDLLSYIPPEFGQKIYDFLTGEHTPPPPVIENDGWRYLNSVIRPIGAVTRYSCYAISSANSVVGMLTGFPNSLWGRILGSIFTALGAELGVVYSHMVFDPRIKKFNKMMHYFRKNIGEILRTILDNPAAFLQSVKSLGIVVSYYTAIGIFYLFSLAEQLSQIFGFPIDEYYLRCAMLTAGILVFSTNVTIRLPATVEKYFSTRYSHNKRADIVRELIISGAGMAFFISRFPEYKAIVGVVAVSGLSLVVGLRTIQLSSTRSEQPAPKIHRLTYWLLFHSRFIKSTFLPFAAIRKISNMLKLGLSIPELILITSMIGPPLGINSWMTYLPLINGHIEYIDKKRRIEKEKKLFGNIGCLFTPSKAYPFPERQELQAILNTHGLD